MTFGEMNAFFDTNSFALEMRDAYNEGTDWGRIPPRITELRALAAEYRDDEPEAAFLCELTLYWCELGRGERRTSLEKALRKVTPEQIMAWFGEADGAYVCELWQSVMAMEPLPKVKKPRKKVRRVRWNPGDVYAYRLTGGSYVLLYSLGYEEELLCCYLLLCPQTEFAGDVDEVMREAIFLPFNKFHYYRCCFYRLDVEYPDEKLTFLGQISPDAYRPEREEVLHGCWCKILIWESFEEDVGIMQNRYREMQNTPNPRELVQKPNMEYIRQALAEWQNDPDYDHE